uniref:Peroxiredoxin-like 2A n=1 Tax=Neovison vison TaxID=452646 RepID=A0A8C7AF88_NEOVI
EPCFPFPPWREQEAWAEETWHPLTEALGPVGPGFCWVPQAFIVPGILLLLFFHIQCQPRSGPAGERLLAGCRTTGVCAPDVPCLLQEAADLSSLKPKLDELGVPLYAVVKEQIRTEVQDFQPYFKGEIFLDEKKRFYGPQRRKMMFMGFVRLGVWYNFFRARNGGFSGNLEGEGFILGGVFVVGSGKQGILLEHREKEFGDKVNPVSVLEAARKIQPQTSAAKSN